MRGLFSAWSTVMPVSLSVASRVYVRSWSGHGRLASVTMSARYRSIFVQRPGRRVFVVARLCVRSRERGFTGSVRFSFFN